MMRALLQPKYGTAADLLLDDIDPPTVGDDDVLVRVHATSLNFGDRAVLTGKPYLFRLFFGLRRPNEVVPGRDVAGVVEAVGPKVTAFAPGDEVFGELSGGSCAEVALAKQDLLVHKPSGVSFEHAAAAPIAGCTALAGLRDAGGIKAGQDVLINGASGGVGTFAIQIAKALGARVTAVCSTRNVDQARSLGADEVIDYTKTDYVSCEPRFDVLFDLVGNHTLRQRRSVLRPEGVYVSSFGQGGGNSFGPLSRILVVALASVFQPRRIRVLAAELDPELLTELGRLMETGAVTPAIENTYPLAEAPEAFRVLLEGHARGKLVITPRDPGPDPR